MDPPVRPASIGSSEVRAIEIPDQRLEQAIVLRGSGVNGHRKLRPLFGNYLERILRFIYVPQFKNLDTVQLSLPASIRVAATDDSGHTFEFTHKSVRTT